MSVLSRLRQCAVARPASVHSYVAAASLLHIQPNFQQTQFRSDSSHTASATAKRTRSGKPQSPLPSPDPLSIDGSSSAPLSKGVSQPVSIALSDPTPVPVRARTRRASSKPIDIKIPIDLSLRDAEEAITLQPTTLPDIHDTPLMGEIREIQSKHPDHILLVQVGGFYEVYKLPGYDYFQQVAEICDLRVANGKVPFVGFPVSQLLRYLERLLKAGKTVAVVDQVDDDRLSRTKTKLRAVTRIATPGAMLDEHWLESKDNNFFMSLLVLQPDDLSPSSPLALAWLDISTGEFFVGSSTLGSLPSVLVKVQPREFVVEKSLVDQGHPAAVAVQDYIQRESSGITPLIARKPSKEFSHATAHPTFVKLLQSNMAKLGTARQRHAVTPLSHPAHEATDVSELLGQFTKPQIQAAGALLRHVAAIYPTRSLSLFNPSKDAALGETMTIDAVTHASLELTKTQRTGLTKGSLLSEIDETVTAVGSRLLVQRIKAPSTSVPEIERRLNLVEVFFTNSHLLVDVRTALKSFKDIERALSKLHLNRGGPADFHHVIQSLKISRDLRQLLLDYAESPQGQALAPKLRQSLLGLTRAIPLFDDLIERYEGFVSEDYLVENIDTTDQPRIIRAGFAHELDRLLEQRAELIQRSEALRQDLTKEYVSPRSANAANLCFDPKHGCLVEFRTAALLNQKVEASRDLKPLSVQKNSKLTRFQSEKWTKLYNLIQLNSEQISILQKDIFADAVRRLIVESFLIKEAASAVAEIDVSAALAHCALERKFTRPQITTEIVGGRHPTVERMQQLRGIQFVRNDSNLNPNESIWVITGIGSFVPAESALIGIADRIFTRIGSSDDLGGNRSTFMVEMEETASILANATAQSLVIMDEVGRGTSSQDGVALAMAIIQYLHDRVRCRTLFATHYHELANLLEMPGSSPSADSTRIQLEHVRFYHTGIHFGQNGKFALVYKVLPGVMTKSHGIDIARLMGLPASVVDNAAMFFSRLGSSEPGQSPR
ncbi:muts domain V-domain-containing protein [Polychytrium aggregatum]|uniref:muts domain V-domain-containing protein n=1 Tax=Polychytrium aggregatum TaxID=110093 RepID=UPI0022FE9858|nr:muts domain V-domain-containing protein [Polychytrium aggregatum]KAI9209459.1 muts domain V-domain-containing protein [Polychytrium aggregatum]